MLEKKNVHSPEFVITDCTLCSAQPQYNLWTHTDTSNLWFILQIQLVFKCKYKWIQIHLQSMHLRRIARLYFIKKGIFRKCGETHCFSIILFFIFLDTLIVSTYFYQNKWYLEKQIGKIKYGWFCKKLGKSNKDWFYVL